MRAARRSGKDVSRSVDPVVRAWRTNARVTASLAEVIPATRWGATIPGMPRKTVRAVLAHLHNSRRAWLRVLGAPHGITVPAAVDRRRVGRAMLLSALRRSGAAMESLLELGVEAGGSIPPTRAYVWRNLPLDVAHVLMYFASHEAHHRGQLLLIARQLGHPIEASVRNGVWHFEQRSREAEPREREQAGRRAAELPARSTARRAATTR